MENVNKEDIKMYEDEMEAVIDTGDKDIWEEYYVRAYLNGGEWSGEEEE